MLFNDVNDLEEPPHLWSWQVVDVEVHFNGSTALSHHEPADVDANLAACASGVFLLRGRFCFDNIGQAASLTPA